MLPFQSWKCSRSLVASVVSLLLLVSVLRIFLSPFWPSSLEYFGVQQIKNSCSPGNTSVGGSDVARVVGNSEVDLGLDERFPANALGAVVYRGASWKAEIGRWLVGCDSVSTPIDIVEGICSKQCRDDCNGQGICNQELGQCRCFHGFDGDGCSKKLQLDCNLPGSPDQPYGPSIVSICPAYCDKTRAMCFCGQGTAYPNRPVAEACGFKMNSPVEPGGPKLTNWTKDDRENIFTTNSSKSGWCNVDPKEAYASKVKFKMECDCKYDCLWGQFCEIATTCSCINQCSGHGHCRGGFCQCDRGWYGIDCSIPSVSSPIQEWPKWLRPSTVDISDGSPSSSSLMDVKAIVKKKRPLIYVYDLPPEFNSHLLEGRHFKFECVNRIYTDQNRTLWTDQLYGSQIALYESILASPHRTLNGEEADYFYVPVLDACIITRADDAPHLSLRERGGLRSYLTLEFYKKAYDHIVEHYPYWNRSSGRDHIWFFSWDEGACYAPKEIWNSMMLVHWGNTNSKHNHSTTAYWADNWDNIPSSKRGDHPCFDPKKDLVLPAWKRPDPAAFRLKLWAKPRKERSTLFYFNGNLGPAYENGRPEDTYSMGIRQKLANEFGSTTNKQGKLGRQHAKDVIVTPQRSSDYYQELASSVFCGVLPGDGWSGRMEDSILQGCIPVVIQDGIFLPYENVLDYRSFAIRINEDEIPNLIRLLRGINETMIEVMLQNVRMIWQRFLYRDSVLLEAERQKKLFVDMEDWAVMFSKLGEDDVFSTFIQVLHYKLHNSPWRQQLNSPKGFGLPKTCLGRRKYS
uniref:Putative glucuronoxylan glucuronosyltransferase F8H n=1 Tax=Anthurium amnicola TaxID=1678845 RepID=A0A1D1Z4M1_9ARAE